MTFAYMDVTDSRVFHAMPNPFAQTYCGLVPNHTMYKFVAEQPEGKTLCVGCAKHYKHKVKVQTP